MSREIIRYLPWVIIANNRVNTRYGSCEDKIKAQEYAAALDRISKLPCRVVHRDELDRPENRERHSLTYIIGMTVITVALMFLIKEAFRLLNTFELLHK